MFSWRSLRAVSGIRVYNPDYHLLVNPKFQKHFIYFKSFLMTLQASWALATIPA